MLEGVEGCSAEASGCGVCGHVVLICLCVVEQSDDVMFLQEMRNVCECANADDQEFWWL